MSESTRENSPLTLESWPSVILHIDGDAFFASCEQAIHPELKGKPVITGKERNIVASMSYEAKALGIQRAVPLWEARKLCPDAVILPSDYETYSLISKRMFAILRRFTPLVEESSIDEGYADLEGLRRVYRTGYEEIAQKIQTTLEKELDIPASAGLSLTKTLSKIASRYQKPRGFTSVPGYRLHEFLRKISVEEVPGIGPNTTALLAKKGIFTAWDYVQKPEPWIRALLGKIGSELWHELRGEKVYGLTDEMKDSYATVSKTKTFAPPSSDLEYVKAQLFRNAESAFIKIRRYRLAAQRVCIFLRQQNFRSEGMEGSLNRPNSCPLGAFPLMDQMFHALFRPGTLYRQTAVLLSHLASDEQVQFELFEDPLRMLKMRRLSQTIDEINQHYGKHTVFSAQGLYLKSRQADPRGRGALPQRKISLLLGETFRQHLGIPLVQLKIS